MFIGRKTKFFFEFLKPQLPKFINTYVEPFGGSFGVGRYINVNKKIYNDIMDYGLNIEADEIYHVEYSTIIDMYDSETTLFYLDPPYKDKEHWYDYLGGFTHEALKEKLDNIKGKFILSYEDCKFIRNLYSDYTILRYTGDKFALRNELLITNILL